MTAITKPGPAAVAAADWWAEQVGAPTFRNTDGHEDPRSEMLSGFAGVLAEMLAETNPINEADGRRFAEALAPKIQEVIDRGYGSALGVDYGPDPILADAAALARISTSRFPWKTVMWAHADHVTASLGYHGQTRLVWASEDWLTNRPPCGSQKWDESRRDADYHGDPFICSLPKYHDQPCRYDQPITLCATCGRTDGWYHDRAERGHMPDFHEFAGAAS